VPEVGAASANTQAPSSATLRPMAVISMLVARVVTANKIEGL